jgi:parallel beta-helix repeat protein
LISGNTLDNNKKGVVLWRNNNITITNNKITGNKNSDTYGIALNEARDSTVWGNTVTKVDKGISLTHGGRSMQGTVNNVIGFHVDGGKELMAGNAISEVAVGIILETTGLQNNAFKTNWIADFTTACDYGKDNSIIATGNNPESCNTK